MVFAIGMAWIITFLYGKYKGFGKDSTPTRLFHCYVEKLKSEKLCARFYNEIIFVTDYKRTLELRAEEIAALWESISSEFSSFNSLPKNTFPS